MRDSTREQLWLAVEGAAQEGATVHDIVAEVCEGLEQYHRDEVRRVSIYTSKLRKVF